MILWTDIIDAAKSYITFRIFNGIPDLGSVVPDLFNGIHNDKCGISPIGNHGTGFMIEFFLIGFDIVYDFFFLNGAGRDLISNNDFILRHHNTFSGLSGNLPYIRITGTLTFK